MVKPGPARGLVHGKWKRQDPLERSVFDFHLVVTEPGLRAARSGITAPTGNNQGEMRGYHLDRLALHARHFKADQQPRLTLDDIRIRHPFGIQMIPHGGMMKTGLLFLNLNPRAMSGMGHRFKFTAAGDRAPFICADRAATETATHDRPPFSPPARVLDRCIAMPNVMI